MLPVPRSQLSSLNGPVPAPLSNNSWASGFSGLLYLATMVLAPSQPPFFTTNFFETTIDHDAMMFRNGA